ncbi:SDR family oxidoreductase [Mucilaginibacter dorajii]|uniref:SDR family NAD(P)-dependent oxidoreductase n=1 Tax=Mucilaginibacter dorajii TaxID=692994 RepID=A0ABP7Q9V8_9SPHI|nr:SDR family NAD(P)-dependent oxidoreductase [Mucilaginibacter dorajii]MCS3733021.1 putative oxidoreductase [Mucilaginibacter dorajii]
MKTLKNTILITGGSAGIGFELAKSLSAKDNHVIIIGRNADRLQKAAAQLQNVTAITADVSNADDVEKLVNKLNSDFPELNIVINNAGAANLNDLLNETNTFEKAGEEMLTNYLSVIRLNEKLLSSLKGQKDAAIVNVSSVVAFAPSTRLATYSATKAALHAYTRALRLALTETSVKVFELMPPLVDTEFSAEIGGKNGIPASQVADEFLAALESDTYEIRVANTEDFYRLYLSNPDEALRVMNLPRA